MKPNIFNIATKELNQDAFLTWHGTACAGIIGALRNNNIGVAGIAGGNGQPNTGVSLVSLACNQLTSSALTNAIALGSSITFQGGWGFFCDLLSNSWGGSDSDPAIKQSVKLAFDNHCVFLASRGNFYANSSQNTNAGINSVTQILYPSGYKNEWVINVGASGNDGLHKTLNNGDNALGGFYESMYSNKVDVIAPGSLDIVISTEANNANPGGGFPAFTDPNYTRFSGTSSSCPHAAGLAALMLSHHQGGNYPNSLDDGDIQHLMKKYANDLGNEGTNFVGQGKINAQATLEHIDLNHGYWVMHSQQANSSFTGQLTNMGNNIQVSVLADDIPIANGVYFAVLFKNDYTHTIPLPSFTTNPQILDKWITHKGGVSNSQVIDGSYNATVTTQISGNNIIATYTTYIWKIYKNAIGQAINPVYYPTTTNTLTPHFSMLMYDPALATNVENTTLENATFNIYPNPADGKVNVSYNAKSLDDVNIALYNTVGQQIKKIKVSTQIGTNEIAISTTELPAGLYNIVIANSTSTASSKLIISH